MNVLTWVRLLKAVAAMTVIAIIVLLLVAMVRIHDSSADYQCPWVNPGLPWKGPCTIPTSVPVKASCEELDQDSGVGYWIQQIAVADPRTGGTTICVTNGSSATGSLLFAKEGISGHLLESRHLWNANPTQIDTPSVGTGPDGLLYLYIPVRVYYSEGSFTMTHVLLLSEELPIPPTK